MIRISSIGLSFISLVGSPCRAAAGAFHERRPSRLWRGDPVKVSKNVNCKSGSKHRRAMGYSTMSIYTH
jgi:hypothetical protein